MVVTALVAITCGIVTGIGILSLVNNSKNTIPTPPPLPSPGSVDPSDGQITVIKIKTVQNPLLKGTNIGTFKFTLVIGEDTVVTEGNLGYGLKGKDFEMGISIPLDGSSGGDTELGFKTLVNPNVDGLYRNAKPANDNTYNYMSGYKPWCEEYPAACSGDNISFRSSVSAIPQAQVYCQAETAIGLATCDEIVSNLNLEKLD